MSPRLHTTAIFDEGIVYLVLGLGLPAICLTVFVLLASAYLAWHPASRAHLDRVSFRLLVYALLANLTFGITFVIGALTTTPSAGCSFVAFLIYLSRLFSSGMFFCMALNLQLVLVHGVNGQMMEKYYILGTSLLSLACGVAPYAAGALGWNAVNQTCEFKNSDPTGFWWLIGTQTIWVLLMVSGEIITFLVIVAFIISYQLDTRRYRSESTGSQEYYPGDCQSEITRSPIARYRNIILRIGLYPVLSCLMSFSTCILDIHQTRTPEPSQLTETNWRLGILDISIYCVRPLLYSILAVADPSFTRAFTAWRHRAAPPQSTIATRFEASVSVATEDFGPEELPQAGRHSMHKDLGDHCMSPASSPRTHVQTRPSSERHGRRLSSWIRPRRQSADIDVACQI